MSLIKNDIKNIPSNLLADRYIVPPFSILNTITENWQSRKRRWDALGIESVLGRDTKRFNATPVNTFSSRGEAVKKPESISTFDPMLCEVLYKWFSLPDMKILDPFAGGSVRGAVAMILDRDYTGVDISEAQISANRVQIDKIYTEYSNVSKKALYVVSDAYTALDTMQSEYDMLFTCPPYYNLEKYSNMTYDLSNLPTYSDFIDRYHAIIQKACRLLKEDSFAVIVVSEVRDPKTGEYYGFVPDTIKAFTDAGLHYYDEIILENNIGSLPIRAPKYFTQSRKIGRHHQNVLVFWKGDLKHIETKFSAYNISNI